MQKNPETLFLVVDTSIKGVCLALVLRRLHSSEVLWSGMTDGQFASAGKISKLLGEGLQATGCSLDDCHAIAVSVGPGSFTGIKIGLAWCYGLYAPREQQLRWLSLSALDEAASYQGRSEAALTQTDFTSQGTCLFLASTRTHGYLAYQGPGSVAPSSCLYQVGQEESPFGALLPLLHKNPVTLCGEWPLLLDYFKEQKIQWHELSIRQLMELSLQGMISRVSIIDLGLLTSKPPRPRYLRQSTAEEHIAGTYKGKNTHEITSR